MGPIEVLLGNDIVVTVPSDTAATVTEVSEGQFQIENSPQSTAPIVVTFQGQEIELPSGESVTVIEVAIDIKPGSDPNSIDSQDEKGVIPVAILSNDTFNAPSQVDRESLTFGRTGDENSLQRRENGKLR